MIRDIECNACDSQLSFGKILGKYELLSQMIKAANNLGEEEQLVVKKVIHELEKNISFNRK